MTPPRDVQDYEAQARELFRALSRDEARAIPMLAAALRAEGRVALQASIDACDDAIGALQGDREVEAALECIKRIRALIAPAPESPPGPAAYVDALQDPVHTTPGKLLSSQPLKPPAPSQAAPTEPQPPRWRIGSHYGIHVYRGDTPIATFHTVADAQAAVRAYNASLDAPARYVVPAPRLADAEKRIAALEASLAKAHDAIRWACGDEPLKDGRWFNCRAFGHEDNAAPRYWWRSILRLYSGLPDDPAPSKEPPP